MCGIVGFIDGGSGIDQARKRYIAEQMLGPIRVRGPDDWGIWQSASSGVVLGHRRLSVQDLSAEGHQPMLSPCGNLVLIYNGEIYNHLQLRRDLEDEGGHFEWKGHSDTETLLAALRHWGVDGALKRLNGMFAFALWDIKERTLVLARDRIGEKPLYYGCCDSTFLFGSDLKALSEHPDWEGEVDRDALMLYMRHCYVPTPWSIYGGISKLQPAHYVIISDSGKTIGNPRCYWDLGAIAENGVSIAENDADALIDQLEQLLLDAVGLRMAADVPLGAFLSGGYDSTVVAALMQAQSDRPIKTFTIGLHEKLYNEAAHAKAVAKYLGTDHTELYVTSDEAMSVIPAMPDIYSEPFADASQIPTFLVSKLARRDVTVCLSGDGGDELFCGYNRYALGYNVWQRLRLLPPSLRSVIAWILRRTPGDLLDNMQQLLPQKVRVPNLKGRLPKLADVLSHRDGRSFYHELVSQWKHPELVVRDGKEPLTIMSMLGERSNLPGLREQMMYLDMMTYLPDDILTKVDRASMAVSLETRVPLLDHRVVEFSWSVPTSLKYRNGNGKWLLREMLYRYVPRELMERPKMGFGVPIDHWLRGPLREWGEDLLDAKRLSEDGYFYAEPIRSMWKEHINGKRSWHYQLWVVLMFQSWLRFNKP